MTKKRSPGSESNANREIRHRIKKMKELDRLDYETKTSLIERNRDFISMNITENKLKNKVKNLELKKESLDAEISESVEQIEEIKLKRKELGNEHDVIVTDHAMLRYLERYMGIDMDKIYLKILQLPKDDVTRFGNTIVTVYPVKNEVVKLDDLVN